MRIRLQKGKQTELILKAKKEKSWLELSKILKISEHYLIVELKREIVTLSERTYTKLCELANEDYSSFIDEKLDDNWGKVKGGALSNGGGIKEVNIPKISKELSEFYGIMLGDGNLTKIKSYKISTYQIKIVGDSRYDKEYLLDYVKPMIEKLFNIKVNVYKSKNENALNLVSTGKRLVEFLESLGFNPGNKIKNMLHIPRWIKNNREYLNACLRGLYDTDGSIYKLTNQNTHQISFRNYNSALLKDVRNALISLNISPSHISKGTEITITKKSELRKFLKDIGFSNVKHSRKAKQWNLAP